MHYSLIVKLICEMLGTAILVLFGNGAVANVELKGTKGYHNGWLIIAVGYGIGVMIPALMFGPISGSHINPAMTIGLAINGFFSWSEVFPYVVAQLIGAIIGQVILYFVYLPFYKKTENTESILGTCSTISASGSYINGFITEFFGTFLLVLGAEFMLNSTDLKQTIGIGYLGLGFLVCTLVTSLGGPTGPGLNPARDLGPRIVHSLFPLKNKGNSQWSYAWIPVVAPIAGSIIAIFLFKQIY
ncbi:MULTISPECIES: MIP/aquaporin family protein [Clostridium]|uniref:Glycerol facilitator-aquaporin gla n=2 Tax=Clostridium TaxID=1485 RepID=D8GTH2_CLOLD|nr:MULTISPECIES: MIP/aquaporin family protein [Clostridium]ADK14621.1 predicted glycerol uptake facilitator protein [Clostridium ljungdahlii DSM 13528]OAA85858.1 Glycerol facilitator-aquaporin gla [Clostridium ljungdahlii DSM 13528]RMD01298.1 aquaporin family protein [Clostridium autoethanogenum]